MANVLKIKAGSGVPTTSDIVDREIAFNRSDNKLYINDSGTIVNLSGAQGGGSADEADRIVFDAQAGEALSKGDVVYISGISGNTPIVSKADADDANKMPSFGLAAASASLNNSVQIVTFGTLENFDTSAFSVGDTVFVSSTAGGLTSTAPTGESGLIQNMGHIVRSHASTGAIKIVGAGRTAATPNLNQDKIFLGNASNQSTPTALSSIGLSKFNNDSGYLTSFDITTQTDPKYLRSNADDTWSGNISTTSTNGIRFGNANQTDGNDGYIAAGRFASGLNIVGTQTVAGQGRKVRIYGDLIDSAGVAYIKTNSSLNASNLTSGTVPDARIAASSITQHTDSKYLRSNAADTASGIITFSSGMVDNRSNVGSVGSTGIEGNQLSTTDWSNFPVGFGGMMRNGNQSYGNPGSTYYYFHKIANRDSGGGWGGIAVGYNNNAEFYVGTTSVNTSYATWSKVWNESNDGSGSGLDADTVDGQHASAFLTSVPNHSASLITSGTLNNARLNTDMQLSAAAPRYKLQETGVTNTPTWWMIADGGNYSIRLNNTGAYPFAITTDSDNDAVSKIEMSTAQERLELGTGTGANYLRTSAGYIQFGPLNSGWGHIQTDRASFYFNKRLTVDEGIVQSYDEDLVLRRANSSADRIDITDTYTRTITDNAETFRFASLNRSFNNLAVGPINNNSKAYIRANNGYSTATTPDYTWWYNDQCGIYHPAGNTIGFSASGEKVKISTYGLYSADDIYIAHGGSDYSPGLQFMGGSNTPGANEYENGKIAYYDNSGTAYIRYIINRSAGGHQFYFGATRMLSIKSDGHLELRSDGSSQGASIQRVGGIQFTWDRDSYGTSNNHAILTSSDDLLINSYDDVTVNLDSNNNDSGSTFMVRQHSTTLTGGTLLFQVNQAGKANSYGGFQTIDGSAASPAFSFNNDPDLGFYRNGANNMRFSAGNAIRGTWNGDGLVLNGGSLGVNVAASTTADGRIDAGNDVVAYSSDKRLKENIRPINNALDKVNKLSGFIYNWNKLANEQAGFDMKEDLVGVYAQDVEEVLPEAVKLAPFDNDGEDNSKSGKNYLTVQYEKMVPLLIEAIKEQQQQINELKEKLNG